MILLPSRHFTWDRYSVIFTGPCIHLTAGEHLYLGMSAKPFSPQGFGQHGSFKDHYVTLKDKDEFAHWGDPIPFSDLPEDCRRLVMDDYCELWEVAAPNATS